MNSNIKDRLIWSFVVLLWIASLWGLSLIPQTNKLLPLIAGLALIMLSGAVLRKTESFRSFFDKLMQVKSEIEKVSWADLASTKKTALMVSVLVAIFAVIMYLVDTVFTLIIKALL